MSLARTRVNIFIASAVAGLVLSACSSEEPSATSSSSPAATTSPAVESPPEPTPTSSTLPTEPARSELPTATLTMIDGDLLLIDPTNGEIAPAEGTPLPPGSALLTSGDDALVEVSWSDGSITRLGAWASFIIGEDAPGGQQDAGIVWHRVTGTSSADYAILAAGTLVTTSGAGFVLDCGSGDCTAMTFEGSVQLGEDTLDAHESGKVSTRGFEDRSPMPWAALFAHGWSSKNVAMDAALGFAGIEQLYRTAGANLGSIAGVFTGSMTYTKSVCIVGDCEALFNPFPVPGDVAERTYELTIDCGATLPCGGMANAEYNAVGEDDIAVELLELTFDGERYSWEMSREQPICLWEDGTTEGAAFNLVSWELEPTKAEFRNGVFQVTEAKGTVSAFVRIDEPVSSPECEPLEREWENAATLAVALT